MLTVAPAQTASPPDDRPHAVVIGAGFGGLAAGVRLGARGWRVTVLERLDQVGGRASVFTQDGFTFDAGPTIVTAPFLFEELWAMAGRRMSDDVDLRPVDPFYRLVFADGSTFEAHAGHAAAREEVARLAPADLAGYDRFMARSAEIYRVGFERLGAQRFDSAFEMAKAAPDLLRLGGLESVHGLVSRYVRDERLRIALSFHPLFVGGDPFAATSVYCLISHLERAHGVHYVVGGTGVLARGLKGLIEGQGGRVRFEAEVDEILARDGAVTGVRLSSGEVVRADIVVSNADTAFTYARLLRNAPRRRWTDAAIARARVSMSLFVWYFGVRGRYDEVGRHTILLGPRYRGLIKDIFRKKRLADDFSLYLHRPTREDPALAPEGCDGFYVLSPVPHLDAGIDWAERAEPYRQAIERRLEATLLPGLSRRIVTSKIFTPSDFESRYLAWKGAAFGFEPVLTQSAWFRPHNKSEELKGLFLVGAGTHPGAGLPGVLSSARVLDAIVPAAAHA